MVIFDDVFWRAYRQIGPKIIQSFEWVEQNLKPTHDAIVDDDKFVKFNHLRVDQQAWKLRGVSFFLTV